MRRAMNWNKFDDKGQVPDDLWNVFFVAIIVEVEFFSDSRKKTILYVRHTKHSNKLI